MPGKQSLALSLLQKFVFINIPPVPQPTGQQHNGPVVEHGLDLYRTIGCFSLSPLRAKSVLIRKSLPLQRKLRSENQKMNIRNVDFSA